MADIEVQTREEPGFIITISKQTAMTGEVISVSTNLPKGSSSDDIWNSIDSVTRAIDKRMSAVNDKVLARTGKTIDELGLRAQFPGFPGDDTIN